MTTRRKFTTLAVASGATVVVAALGAAGAIAASGALSPKEESRAVIEDAAGRLGVAPNELSEALKQALKNRVDAAVEAGRLTEEQGKALEERIDSGETPLLFGMLGGHGLGGMGHVGHPAAHLDTAATYLGLDEAELHDRLAGGKSLADVATAEGKSVDGLVEALVQEAKGRLDEAVADGRLTQKQANELEEGLEARITALVNGERPERSFGGPGFRLGPGLHEDGFGLRRHGPFA